MRRFALVIALIPACSGDEDPTNLVVPGPGPTAHVDILSPPPFVVNSPILIDGSGSVNAESLSWAAVRQPSGATVSLAGDTPALAELIGDVAGDYIVELTATNAEGSDTALALVEVCADPSCAAGTADGDASHATIAVRTPAPFVVGDTVLLDGSDSLPTDSALSFTWSLFAAPGASSAAVSTLSAGLAELTGDAAGDFIVELEVTGTNGSDSTFALIVFEPPPACISNSDCAEPTAVCDTARNICVECLLVSDCAHRPGTVCDLGSCACTGGLDWCAPDLCIDLARDPDNCGSCGRRCYGSCVAGDCADVWEPVSDDGAPSARTEHVAVWADQLDVMVVWGGSTNSGLTNTGGIYDPATFEWRPTSIVGAPSPRERATAVWTGTEMIVWGGYDGAPLATGARLNVRDNTWTPVSTAGAPSARHRHTAIWSGTEMIVWGGDGASDQLGSGGRYTPSTDSWTPTAAASGTTRRSHTAVWSSSANRMLIYGGYGDPPGFADVYLPSNGAPGGEAYDPINNLWQSLNTIGEPAARTDHTAVFDGVAMLVWGGYSGAGYLDSGASYGGSAWSALVGTAPEARRYHTAVWLTDAGQMVIWGGSGASSNYLDTGASYDPRDQWLDPIPTAPEGRRHHTAISTGARMIIWGGEGAGGRLSTGAIYTP